MTTPKEKRRGSRRGSSLFHSTQLQKACLCILPVSLGRGGGSALATRKSDSQTQTASLPLSTAHFLLLFLCVFGDHNEKLLVGLSSSIGGSGRGERSCEEAATAKRSAATLFCENNLPVFQFQHRRIPFKKQPASLRKPLIVEAEGCDWTPQGANPAAAAPHSRAALGAALLAPPPQTLT